MHCSVFLTLWFFNQDTKVCCPLRKSPSPRLFQQPLRLSHRHVSEHACFVIRRFPEWKLWQRMWQLHTRRTSERDYTHTLGRRRRRRRGSMTEHVLGSNGKPSDAPPHKRPQKEEPGKPAFCGSGLGWSLWRRQWGKEEGFGAPRKMWVTVGEENESNNMMGELHKQIHILHFVHPDFRRSTSSLINTLIKFKFA